jgi:hypothetical protein
MKRTALEENRRADSRTVVQRRPLQIKNNTGGRKHEGGEKFQVPGNKYQVPGNKEQDRSSGRVSWGF